MYKNVTEFKVFKAEVKEEILTEVEEKMQALKIENLEKVEKAKGKLF